MAGVRRGWIWPPLMVCLFVAAWAGLTAQAPATGVLAGRLTDLYSVPLDGAVVVVRNDATGAEARTRTGRNGSYRFSALEPGEYTLEAQSERLGQGRLGGIVVAAGHEARVQAAMAFELPEPAPIQSKAQRIEAAIPASQPAEANLSAGTPAIDLAKHPAETVLTPANRTISTPIVTAAASVPAPPLSRPTPSLVEGARLAVKAADASPLQATLKSAQIHVGASRADSPRIDPVTPVVTTTLMGEQLQELPVSGRRWQDFVLDTPAAASAIGGTSQTSLRGAGQIAAETTVDGASVRLAFGGAGSSGSGSSWSGSNGQGGSAASGMGQAWAGGRGPQVAAAAIREVQTVAGNVEAEGARAAGGRMGVETERGRNGLHGQGFLSDRENIWGAQNPFTQWVKETARATEITPPVFTPESYTPPDHETVWGVGAGSQIRRDKLFWFAALDSFQRNDPGLATVKHPDEFFGPQKDAQMEMLSTRTGVSSNNPLAAGVAEYSSMLETLGGLLGPAPRTAKQWVEFGRIDWEAAERHRFVLEGIGATWDSPGGGLTRVSETNGSNSFGSSKASQEWLLGRWEAFLTPNLLAVTQGSTGRNILSAHAETPSAFEQTLLSPSVWGQLPQIVVDNRYGLTIGNPSRFGAGSYPDERLYEGQESLDWVRGSLMVRAGFDLSHNSDATSLLRNQTGTYSYENAVNFTSDAWAFKNGYGELNQDNQHNCDATGVGFGNVPCYSYYSQTMGPANWHLSTNDWAGYVTTQWQPKKQFVVSGGLRWEREQLPPPIAELANPELPLTEKLPGLGNNWGPRISMALGNAEGHWPVLRMGYGMYFGRTENSSVETALTQTGSAKGDLNLFMRPSDDLPNNGGGAPPFPYVLSGQPASVVKPGVVEFAPNFHNPEVHQAVAALEETLPGHVEVTASAMLSLGRRLPVPIDANLDTAVAGTITYAVVNCPEQLPDTAATCTGSGPIKAPRITVPFYASWPSSTESVGIRNYMGWLKPDYQQIDQITSKANSTYEAAVLKVSRYGRRGLSLHAHYTYSHAMDWNPNESPLNPTNLPSATDPVDFGQEYGTSDQDMRHSAAAMVIYEAPWKLHHLAGELGNGWMVSGIGQFHSGLPYTMRESGSLPECPVSTGVTPCTTPYAGLNATTGDYIMGLRPGMNGSGGDNRVYGKGSDGQPYNIGRNTYRYPATWKADLRLSKSFDLGEMRKLELLVESFNLFNHQNVTELETTGYYLEPGNLSGGLPTLNFLTGQKASTTAFGQPLNVNATDFYRERQVQVGLKLRF